MRCSSSVGRRRSAYPAQVVSPGHRTACVKALARLKLIDCAGVLLGLVVLCSGLATTEPQQAFLLGWGNAPSNGELTDAG